MMKAKKCDRCEKYYDPYPVSPTTKWSNMLIFAEEKQDSYMETRQFELCPKCMLEAVEFMQELLPDD